MSKTKRIIESAHTAMHFPKGETRQHNGTPSQAVQDLPWYQYVPKTPLHQAQWRQMVRLRASEDVPFRHAIMEACEEDILFFANTLAYVFEPRLRGNRAMLPMNTWRDQDDHIAWLEECFCARDCLVEKARDLSLSWDCVLLFYKHWLTDPLCKMGMVSLTEEKVDSVEDSSSLMWKLDYLHSWIPDWWRLHGGKDILERGSYNHKFHNRIRKSTITGYACTGNVSRGGRLAALLMDEFAEWPPNAQQMALDSSQYAAKSRYVVSTFTSDSDRFFQITRREHSQSVALRIICDWKDNPEKKKGLYTSIGGHLKVLDHEYIYPADYPYILDGKIRSPYYDEACTRPGSTPQSIARELDRDPQGVTSKIFSAGVLEKARATCKPPYHKGNLDFVPGIYEPIWMSDHQGLFSIWKDLNPETGKLGWGGPYAIGCDIAHGSGSSVASNSALEVFDIASGEQVLEYYSNKINPVDFAQLVFTTCKWLCQGNDLSWAYLNFENNGEPGHAFGAEIVRLGWSNVYYTQKESVLYKQRSDKIGHHNQDGGYGILSEMQRAIQQDECILHSETTVFECGQYEMGGVGRHSGKCVHVGSRASGDPTSQGKSHGDCAIAAGLAWMARCDRPVEKAEGFVDENPDSNPFAEFERKFGKRRLPLSRRGREAFENFRNVG